MKLIYRTACFEYVLCLVHVAGNWILINIYFYSNLHLMIGQEHVSKGLTLLTQEGYYLPCFIALIPKY